MALKTNQRGSALVYILIAIALLAALTATFMDSSSQQTSSQNSFNTVSDLNTQANFIRSAIQECVLSYPAGDTVMPADPVGGKYPVRPYPLNPRNSYLLNPTSSSGTVEFVDDIRCPGNPGNSNNHAKIFAGSSGKFMPKPPALFSQWSYYNNIDGVFFMTMTNKTDAYLATALKKLDSQFSKCETQFIDATAGVVQTTSNNEAAYACTAGNLCFRVWILAKPTAVYPGETGCP